MLLLRYMQKGYSVVYLIISAALVLGLVTAGYKYGYKAVIKQSAPIPAATVFQSTATSPGILNKDLRTVPKATPFSPPPAVGTTDQITVSLNKNTFSKEETVEINIKNGTNQTLGYLLGPGCGILFERQINGQFKQQTVSVEDGSAALCSTSTLGPSGSKAISRKIVDNAPSGVYRIQFQYYNGSAYSQIFQIL